jgi:hypothetical protein
MIWRARAGENSQNQRVIPMQGEEEECHDPGSPPSRQRHDL